MNFVIYYLSKGSKVLKAAYKPVNLLQFSKEPSHKDSGYPSCSQGFANRARVLDLFLVDNVYQNDSTESLSSIGHANFLLRSCKPIQYPRSVVTRYY